MTTQPNCAQTTAKLRAVIADLRAAAHAYHALYFKSLQAASIETQNFCMAVQLMVDDLSVEPTTEDLRRLLSAGIDALAQDACAASTNVFSALANARCVLTETEVAAKEGVR